MLNKLYLHKLNFISSKATNKLPKHVLGYPTGRLNVQIDGVVVVEAVYGGGQVGVVVQNVPQLAQVLVHVVVELLHFVVHLFEPAQ